MTDRGNQRSNRDRPNRGQDENTHTYVNEGTGETREGTQRQFRTERWANEGFVNQDDVAEAPAEDVPAPTAE